MNVEQLQKQVDLLMENISGFEENAIAHIMQRITGFEQSAIDKICERVAKIGKMSSYDAQALKNAQVFSTQDMNDVIKIIAKELNATIPEIQKMYNDVLQDGMSESAGLYEYRGIEQIPIVDDKKAQALINSYAKTTGETFVNLTKTKALNLVSPDGIVKPFASVAEEIFAKSAVAVSSGTEDFYSVMRNALKQLGGGGIRVSYSPSVSRRLDSVLRQNLLWSSKQVFNEYEDYIGETLNCDAWLISYHSNPRPSHREIGGQTYAIGKSKTVNGIRYESNAKAKQLLSEYGCLHSYDVGILGISEPAIDQDELERLKAHDSEMVEYNGRTMSRYEWKQYQRKLETEIRKNKDIANTFKSAGDMQGRKATQNRINTLQERYDDMTDKVGLEQTKERMSVSGFRAVKGTKDVELSAPTKVFERKEFTKETNKELNKIIQNSENSQNLYDKLNHNDYIVQEDAWANYNKITKRITINTEEEAWAIIHESAHKFDFENKFNYVETYTTRKGVVKTFDHGEITASDYLSIKMNSKKTNADLKVFAEKIGTNFADDWFENEVDAFEKYMAWGKTAVGDGVKFGDVSDIFSAVTEDVIGASIMHGGHTSDYWLSNKALKYNEMFANFVVLKETQNKQALDLLKETLPNHYNELEEVYNLTWNK